jgi:hypothetical protein
MYDRCSAAFLSWPLVGNSKLLATILLRGPLKSSPLAMALMPADAEAVMAISSVSAFNSRAT